MQDTTSPDQADGVHPPQPTYPLLGFLVTQFLGAFNDNVYKMVLSLVAVSSLVHGAGGSTYLPLIGALFILPFFLFSGYAGYLADVRSKRQVLVIAKTFEIVVMGLGFVAFLVGRIELMLGVLFLMALQSTFFSPAKYGILPEMLPNKDLSRANGWLEMSTFLAIILGTTVGSAMFTAWQEHLETIGLILVVIAVAGTLASFSIPRVPPSGTRKPFRINPWSEILSGLTRLSGERPLWLTVVGIAYFWFLGALLQMVLIVLGKDVLGADDLHVGLLQTFLAVGIGVGSLAAGRLSGDKVELGLVPLGSLGMGLCAILLAMAAPAYIQVATALVFLGFSAGLFIVPLHAFVQQKSGSEEKGRLLATMNFMSTGGILLASAILWVCQNLLHIRADHIILIFGCVTLLGTVYILRLLPDFLVRFVLWSLTHTIYRIRLAGAEHVPLRGPALLVCNHVSFVDGFLVGACVQRFIRFIVYKGFYDQKLFQWLFRLTHAIPIAGGHPTEVQASLAQARQALQEGHVVCIFAEGAISRTGNLLPFKRGFERIMHDLDVPIIPVHLDRVWGSVFSFKDGRFGWKWPRQIPYPVTVSFGVPLPTSTTAAQARQAIMELGCRAVAYRRTQHDLLQRRFIATAKRHWSALCVADDTGHRRSYGHTLVHSIGMARWLRAQCPHARMVGLLLPASTSGVLANIAVLLAGKVPVNLDYTVGREAMLAAIEQIGIHTVVTSRQFLSQSTLGSLNGMLYVEDAQQQHRRWQHAAMLLVARLLPARLLQWLYTPRGQTPDTLATVICVHRDTGEPQGVMLSHHNILSTLESVQQLFSVTSQDRVLGTLPFFHALGLTVTCWFPLIAGCGVIYPQDPTDASAVGELVHTHQATLLLSTPALCRTYIQRCSPAAFASLRYAFVGTEPRDDALAQAFQDVYSVPLLLGYGCAEMAPIVAVNVPDVQHGGQHQIGTKLGTVGHPIPGVVAQVVAPETGQPLSPETEGLLLVKGPNRMLGYVGQPDQTAAVLRGEWYITGARAVLDHDGFIRLTQSQQSGAGDMEAVWAGRRRVVEAP